MSEDNQPKKSKLKTVFNKAAKIAGNVALGVASLGIIGGAGVLAVNTLGAGVVIGAAVGVGVVGAGAVLAIIGMSPRM